MKLQRILKQFPDFHCITKFDISESKIRNITVIDAPDTVPFINKGDMIITTAYMFRDNPENLLPFIRELKRVEAAALGIKLNRFLKVLPVKVIEEAEKLKFPLIDIPGHYTFLEIMAPVMSTLLHTQMVEMRKIEEIHTHFTKMLVRNCDMDEFLQFLYRILKKSFVFCNYFTGETYKQGGYAQNINLSYRGYRQSIFGQGRLLGEFIYQVHENEMSHIEKMAIEHCLAMMHIKISRQILMAKMEESYKNDFIADICLNNINSIEELYTRAKIYNWDMSGLWSCVIFDIDHFKANIVDNRWENSELENYREKMFLYIQKSLQEKQIEFHYFTKSDSIIFLVKSLTNEDSKNIRSILHVIQEDMRIHFPFTFTIGLGMLHPQLMDIHLSYEEAIESVKVGRAISSGDEIFIYNEIEFFKLMSEVVGRENQTPYFLKGLNKLLKFDHEKNKDYIHTLKILIEQGWSVQATADLSFMHYNTIKYRLDRISEITEMDFNNPNERFLMELAFRYMKFKKDINFL